MDCMDSICSLNFESRNAKQEEVLEYLKTHTNSVIDLEKYNLLHNWKASDAASLVIQSIFAASVFSNSVIGIDSADAKDSILGLGLAAVVRTTVHEEAKKIFQSIDEQISMQHDDWLQAHSVYFVSFANSETYGEVICMGAKLLKSRCVSADSGVFSGDAGKYVKI